MGNKHSFIATLTMLTMLGSPLLANEDGLIVPNYADTELAKEAKNCHPIDLTTWKHPTRQVLLKYHAKILKVELCNERKYPIFTVEAHYSLWTQPNQKQANSFFNELWLANGKWSFALVDKLDNMIYYVERVSKDALSWNYQLVEQDW